MKQEMTQHPNARVELEHMREDLFRVRVWPQDKSVHLCFLIFAVLDNFAEAGFEGAHGLFGLLRLGLASPIVTSRWSGRRAALALLCW